MEFSGIREKTLVIIKPDAIQRGLLGQVTSRFEQKGLKLVATKMAYLKEETLREHYAHIADKPFYPAVEEFMMSSPAVIQCWEGLDVVNTVRLITGITKAREAEAGSIRGDFAMSVACNVIHASDSIENAQAEVARFFDASEIHEYDKSDYQHVYAEEERTK
ncbi:MAG: nucleoside-diphosphate kinase [Candidatus Magasanikbacteria bacterium CG_4_10_14_0_2_um_filter_33_14]|uniref:Nucleoside diphosphate kinase n=1 Tax=Candidatus Magasanikbacteria bacterium CG_4_10_14_0_2_um_filter_33_14 TaxID=1974636 RepID=A0A2M7V949_9BACT|nr:MAG: nucleoside-diphosphate kinase [Candidatus Magasanikbacteria bacterium CG_4_10_14_0_2_um_filter_33_14]